MTIADDTFLSREPWWYKAADSGSIQWGYLYTYANATFRFAPDETPPDSEIKESAAFQSLSLFEKISEVSGPDGN